MGLLIDSCQAQIISNSIYFMSRSKFPEHFGSYADMYHGVTPKVLEEKGDVLPAFRKTHETEGAGLGEELYDPLKGRDLSKHSHHPGRRYHPHSRIPGSVLLAADSGHPFDELTELLF